MSGPPPTPTKVLESRGSWRAKVRAGEPTLPVERPSCPAFLKGEARKEWTRAVGQLLRMRVVTKADRALLAAYCEAWGEFLQATAELEGQGYTFTTDKGYVGPSPWVAIKNKAVERLTKLADRFGFSPAARRESGRWELKRGRRPMARAGSSERSGEWESLLPADQVPSKWRCLLLLIPGYDPLGTAEGCRFDPQAAQTAIDFFPACIRHVEGGLTGQPFELQPWQQAVIACLFGWKRLDELGRVVRRYSEVLVYIPRKNGKTPFAAGIALLIFFGSNEGGQQAYIAAESREQAGKLFRQAKGMVQAEPELDGRCRIYGGTAQAGQAKSLVKRGRDQFLAGHFGRREFAARRQHLVGRCGRVARATQPGTDRRSDDLNGESEPAFAAADLFDYSRLRTSVHLQRETRIRLQGAGPGH